MNLFGQEVLLASSYAMKRALLLNYFKSFINTVLASLCVHCMLLNVNCSMILDQKAEIFTKLQVPGHDFPDRSPIHETVNYVLEGNFDMVAKLMSEAILKPFENFIYEQTWIFKGRIQGDFGRNAWIFNETFRDQR